MLKSLKAVNFTTFTSVDLTFAKGLNLFVGENATGKTHILKLAYSALTVCAPSGGGSRPSEPTKAYFQTAMADKLRMVFKPDELGRLASRFNAGRHRCEVECRIDPGDNRLGFEFNTSSKSEVRITKVPSKWLDAPPVYLPTRELLTIYPGFVSLFETTHLQFDETWRDTCLLLGAPLAKGPREAKIKKLLVPVEEAMGGRVELDKSGRFYLKIHGVNMEMHLVAEGFRKLAMLARLIATGSLVDKGYLFWDEPEANLNPKVTKLVARVILDLCRGGIQVFIATHSVFLMREVDILLQTSDYKDVACRYVGLHRSESEGVRVQQGETSDDIGDISALREELQQSDRYLELGGK
jgi:predicted ATPase